ncbi:MAG: hypothetical protein ACE5GA_04865 [Candidatus Zixiibacteriota bacterium]
MRTEVHRRSVVILAFALCLTPLARQTVNAEGFVVNTHAMFQTWKVTDSAGEMTITQWALPLSGIVPLENDFALQYYAAGARSDLDETALDYDLTAASDVRFLLNRRFADDRFLLGVGLNLPTGKQNLDFALDTVIINQLSESYLSFPLRRFGQGFGVNFLGGAAGPLGVLDASVGVIYELTGEYDPYEGEGAYDPGNFFMGTLGAVYRAERFVISGNLSTTIYSADRLDDKKVVQQSARISLRLAGAYASGKSRVNLSAGYLLRGRNKQFDSQEAIVRQLQLLGDEFSVNGSLDFALDGGWSLGPRSEVRLISGDELAGTEHFGSSEIFGFGGRVGKRLSSTLSLSLNSRYYTGSANDGLLDVSGVSLSLSLFSAF